MKRHLFALLFLLACVPAFAQVNLLPLVQQVAAENPALLQTNTNVTCYEFTRLVLARLKAEGHVGWGFIGKTAGEGQYQPPTGFPRQIGPHLLTGVSHDAIGSATQRVDILGGGNDSDRPIFSTSTAPFWSFDPADGPRIVARPQWVEIPPMHWRPNNPVVPFDATPGPGPQPPPPPPPVFPPYPMPETQVDGAGSALFADFAEVGQTANPEMFRFAFRVAYDWLTKQVPTLEAAVAKHRREWRALLHLPVLP